MSTTVTDPTTAAAEDRTSKRWAVLAVAFALLPIVVALVRALAGHWVPVGDDAYFAIRSRDVFGSHIPLLGTWTSASLNVGREINNPGPLYFDLLAIPVAALGPSAGVAVGAALVNGGAVVGIAAAARRRGGTLVTVLAMLVTGLLAWAMGSLLLFDPWQPHAMLLPFLCFMLLAWSLACGDLVVLPWAVGLGSLLGQTHLTYVFLAGALGAWGIVGLVLELRRRRRHDEERPGPRRVVQVVVVAVIVGAVCWLPPVVEQLFRDGNLGALVASSSFDGPVLGARHAVQVTAKVLTLPPFWSRSGFSDAFTPASGGIHAGPGGIGLATLPEFGLALGSLLPLVAVLAVAGVLRARKGDRTSAAAAVTALVALAAGFWTASRLPTAIFGVAAHQLRWLWPVGAFALLVVLVAGCRAWAERGQRPRAPVLVVTATVLVAVVAIANLPAHDAGAGPAGDGYAIPIVRSLDRQVARARLRGPVLVDVRDVTFGEPYNAPMMAALQRAGVDFVATDSTLVRQLGPGRRARRGEARTRVFDVVGDRAATVPPGTQRIAYHAGLDRTERSELARLEALVTRSPAEQDRYDALRRRWARETVGIFVGPVRAGSVMRAGQAARARSR